MRSRTKPVSYAGDFDGQVRLSFGRIRQTLEKAGGKLDDIVTMTVFITDMANGTQIHTTPQRIFPRRPLSGERADRHQGTGAPEMMVEIQAIAMVD